jgi:hypothetical protein
VYLANDPRHGQIGSKSLVKALALPTYTVAGVPPAASHAGRIIHVSNGNAGSPCLAYSNGTAWLRVLLGAAVASS